MDLRCRSYGANKVLNNYLHNRQHSCGGKSVTLCRTTRTTTKTHNKNEKDNRHPNACRRRCYSRRLVRQRVGLGQAQRQCSQQRDQRLDYDYYGRTIGGNILSNLDAYARETGDTLDKEEYLAGLQYLLSEERSNDFLSGVAGAMRILGDMEEYGKMGISLDRKKCLKPCGQVCLQTA